MSKKVTGILAFGLLVGFVMAVGSSTGQWLKNFVLTESAVAQRTESPSPTDIVQPDQRTKQPSRVIIVTVPKPVERVRYVKVCH